MPPMPKKARHSLPADILIAGGGIPGLTLAILLGQAGIKTAVVDPAPAGKAPRPDTRTSALMQDSINIVKAAGAWEGCRKDGGVMEALAIVDGNTQPPIEIVFRAEEIGQDSFGVNMPNSALLASLRQKALKTKNVTLRMSTKLISYEADAFGVTARLDGASDMRARVIIGSDGRASKVREIAGIKTRERDYGQHAITCLIEHSLDHNNTSTEFHRPSGPFTLVPLPGKTSSVVWVDFDEAADAFMRMDKKSFTRALRDRSEGILGEITLQTPPQSWPLKSLKAARLTAKRAALMAEAAHVLHPLGAQGLNLSLRDAAALGETLIEAFHLGQDPGSAAVLSQYESRRRTDIAARVAGTDALNRLVSSSSPLFHRLRRAGIKTLDHVTLLREIAMRHGMSKIS